MFTEKEKAYLKEQRLARIATVSESSQPDVAPVGFDFDGEYFYVSGLNVTKTLKYRNTETNPKVALVVDDLETIKPWRPRGIKIHGTADRLEREGYAGRGIYLRIQPGRKWSWGIEAPLSF
jgi:pyridoxamine 5'-phosphate oxidase family protein